MRGWQSKLSPFAALAIALVTVTAAIAAYTGPIRPRTVSVQDGYVRRIYRNSPWQQVCECRYSGDINARCADNDYGCHCSEYPSYAYTCYQSEFYVNVTHNPATASGNFTCGTWGNAGWCRSGASLNVSGSEPVGGYFIQRMEGNYDNSNNAAVSCSGASCGFTPPQGQGTFWYWAVSSYGDTSAKNSLGYKFDSGAPSVTLSPSGTPGGGGWYRSNVTVTGSGSDAVSGLASLALSCGTNPCTVTAEGTTTITATATDNAGNTASTALTVRKDTTPPIIAFNPSGTAGNAGWYRSAVTLSATASDADSGVAGLTLSCGGNPCVIGAQGTTNVSGTATDVAGNSGSNAIAIRIDSVAPSVSLSPAGTLGDNGWYVGDVAVTANASDATSGVSGVQTRLNGGAWGGASLTITADGTHTVEGLASDVAGNQSAVVSASIRRDTVPPTVSLNIPAPNGQNGWFISHPTVSASGADATSGVAVSQVRVNGGAWQSGATITADGVHTVEGRAQDNAGHWSGTVSGTVRVDATPPTASVSLPPVDGQNGWYVSDVAVTAQGTDAASGVASREARIGGGAWQANGLTVSADGTHTVTVRVTDAAGNSATATATVRRDATAPTITGLNVSGASGNNGWYRSDVEVSGAAADAASGIALVEVDGQSSLNLSDGVHAVLIRAVDQAGNESTQAATVRVDTTPPSLIPQIPAPNGLGGWHVSTANVDAAASDAVSGVDTLRVQVNGGAWQSLPISLDQDGVYTLTFEAIDRAGNVNRQTRVVYVDVTPPLLTPQISAPDGQDDWHVSEPQIEATASDAASGVASLQVQADNGNWQNLPVVLSEGVHSLTFRAKDQAGNETVITQTVKVDTTPPTLAPLISPADGDNGWHVMGASLDAAASDALSGLAEVRARVNGGAWQTLPLDLTDEGVHEVEIEAEDEAGNVVSRTVAVRIDRTAPRITPSVPAADGKNGWHVSPFEVNYSTDDNLSGVRSSAWRVNGGGWQSGTPQIDGEGEITLDIRAVDNAGNERIRRYGFSLDQTPPQGEIVLTGAAGVEGWYRSAVEAALTGEDAVSGVAELRLAQTVIETEGWHTVSGEVEDNAGWTLEIRRSFGIDLTPPLGGFDPLPELLSGTVELAGAANDGLSGLLRLEISFSMGYGWQEIPFADDRWAFEWDTTQTNGGYKRIYLRLTDKAGNAYTTGVDALVSNTLPQAEITREWLIAESGQVRITPGDLPIRQVCLTIQDPADANRKAEWCGERVEDIPNPVQWDGKFADGTQAAPGRYPVTARVTDIAGRTVTASGTVIIPSPTPAPTFTPTEEPPQPTATRRAYLAVLPTASPTPTATPTQTPTEEERDEATHTPPAVSLVLPTPQPTARAVKPPKFEVQAAEVVRRALWPFLTLIGLAGALGYSAMRDERPQAIRKLAERIERILDLQEVK